MKESNLITSGGATRIAFHVLFLAEMKGTSEMFWDQINYFQKQDKYETSVDSLQRKGLV